MKQRRRSTVPANPLLAWSKLALTTGEMMMASAQVIGHRTARMASAAPVPNARDRREFQLMGQEKLEAAAESAQAVAARMAVVNQQMAALALDRFMGRAAWAVALATSRTMAQATGRQAALMQETVDRSAKTAAYLTHAMPQLAAHGLKPVHARATGNAKRLAKIK